MQEDRKRQSYGFTMGGHRLRLPNAIIPLSSLPKTSNNIIQKGLAFGREQSGTVTVPGARRALGILPRRLYGRGGAAVVAAVTPHQRKGDPDGCKTHQYPTRHSVLSFAAR